jgi:hypothetical protein
MPSKNSPSPRESPFPELFSIYSGLVVCANGRSRALRLWILSPDFRIQLE